jgi:hypothetical protein
VGEVAAQPETLYPFHRTLRGMAEFQKDIKVYFQRNLIDPHGSCVPSIVRLRTSKLL